ncbi:radical SAM family heme chaperone HemW [Flexistipes sp.]|uniref:radical SAM family heme chaperone HemW n=1 Tax=Flexistipes sp. TaxID=3088135 RepID=UPI002E232C5F|nr:radical SAM family heme chaperone HemW [Flexistipes sp.]
MRGLYIHIPFCKSKCKYCGFYSLSNYNGYISQYIDSLIKEASEIQTKNFDTLYIGGGTPSIIDPTMLGKLFSELFKIVKYKNTEFTFEVNPESFTFEQLQVLREYGLNRISLGAQSFDDYILQYLGRIHKKDDILKSYEMIKSFSDHIAINLDIIFDIPGISRQNTENSLHYLKKLQPEHISAYSFSTDTDYFKNIESKDSEEEYMLVKDTLSRNGYTQYEISNYSRQRYHSRHNLLYWDMNEYVGLGAAAHSMLYNENGCRIRYSNPADLNTYLSGTFSKEVNHISEEEMFKEDIIFGLRKSEGINLDFIAKKYDKNFSVFINEIQLLIDENLLTVNGDNICLSQKGSLLLDSVQQYIWEL